MNMILGIDISKRKFDVALFVDNKFKNKQYPNSTRGFTALNNWLSSRGVKQVHACLEATSNYGDALAHYLFNQGHLVSVVNPAKVKGFAQSKLYRNKTDKADAKLIADFCQATNPSLWQPLPEHVTELQALSRRLDDLLNMRQQESNRLSSKPVYISKDIKKTIAYLDKRIDEIKKKINDHIDKHPDLKNKYELVNSIPGVGDITSAKMVAFCGFPERFENAKQMAAFIGVTPRNYQSGSSIQGKTRISKTGDSDLRKSLYFPAIVAIRHNPVITAFAERLATKGKSKMAIICAAMRKLIHIIYGVLKSAKPFCSVLTLG
jgi:transposase